MNYIWASRVIEFLEVPLNDGQKAKGLLVSDFFEPEISKDEDLRKYTEILESANRQGYYN